MGGFAHALRQTSRGRRGRRTVERQGDRMGDTARRVDARQHRIQGSQARQDQVRMHGLKRKAKQWVIRRTPGGFGLGGRHAHDAMGNTCRMSHGVQRANAIDIAPEHGVIQAIDRPAACCQHPVHLLRQAVLEEDFEERVSDQGRLQTAEHAQTSGLYQSKTAEMGG